MAAAMAAAMGTVMAAVIGAATEATTEGAIMEALAAVMAVAMGVVTEGVLVGEEDKGTITEKDPWVLSLAIAVMAVRPILAFAGTDEDLMEGRTNE